MTSAHPRITIEPDKRDGKPCIRGMRITVNDVLGWLSHGMTEEEILDEQPALERKTSRPSMHLQQIWPMLLTAAVKTCVSCWTKTSPQN